MTKIILIVVLLIPTMFGMAEEEKTFFENFSVGAHFGTDFGAAMPIPIGDAFGSGDRVNITPLLRPSFGLSLTKNFNDRWSASFEATYKTVGMDITARVEEQIFVDREQNEWICFRGTANMEMSFPMFEFSLYGRYTFGFGGRIVLGAYHSRNHNPKFIAEPRKGMLFNVVDGRPDFDSPRGIISPEYPFRQDFSDVMSRWDFGILAGYEQQILLPQLFISARFAKGFNDIFHRNHRYLTFNMRHIRASLTLSYHFF